ncbi:MAG: ATP-binding cassette domain-containing protein [Bdellovibrionales bacterium]|nr:ATP-binding cassette domain-containing protein [Bdellovibrionales bacterium]
MYAFEVENLHFYYLSEGSSSKVLNDFSLKVRKGELVAIQGPSGSGKSTLLYLLGLLSFPDSGRIRILGKDTEDLNSDQISDFRSKRLGFVFQQFYLLPKTSVLDNVLLPISCRQSEVGNQVFFREQAVKWVSRVGLNAKLESFSNQLSGGQQQRVAICRALICDPEIILADEPTGNLDSHSAREILELLRDLNRVYKKTVIIITHDNDVAKACDRIVRIKDGKLVSDIQLVDKPFLQNDLESTHILSEPKSREQISSFDICLNKIKEVLRTVKSILPAAIWNLQRHRMRTLLTMMGISVGIAAVFAMISLGEFTRRRILDGYANMGVNTLIFNGVPNWGLKATDLVPTPFRFFDWEADLENLSEIFPHIVRMSPILQGDKASLNFGGRTVEQEAKIKGIGKDGLVILKRKLIFGRNFSSVEVEQRSAVCIIGYGIGERLLSDTQPLGQVLRISDGQNSYSCRVIGVLGKVSSNRESHDLNMEVYLPFSFFQAQSGNWWSSQLKQVLIQLDKGADIERMGRGLRVFFEQKYGPSGKFSVDSDTVLLSQMKQFLSLFKILLSSIAFVTLAVGGIGITNMMLISLSERFREIGLRKALGASDKQIRTQFLLESLIVCSIAGSAGLVIGFFSYHIAIFVAARFVDKMSFQWTFDAYAFLLSLLSILAVGILSGLFPAIKAEKLQVIEALRAD